MVNIVIVVFILALASQIPPNLWWYVNVATDKIHFLYRQPRGICHNELRIWMENWMSRKCYQQKLKMRYYLHESLNVFASIKSVVGFICWYGTLLVQFRCYMRTHLYSFLILLLFYFLFFYHSPYDLDMVGLDLNYLACFLLNISI